MKRTRAPVLAALGAVIALAFAGQAQATVKSGITMKMISYSAVWGPYRLDVKNDPVADKEATWDLLPCLSDQTIVYNGLTWQATAYSGNDAAMAGTSVPAVSPDGIEIWGSGTPNKRIDARVAWEDWWLSRQMGTWTAGSVDPLSPYNITGPNGLVVNPLLTSTQIEGIHGAIWTLGGGTGYSVPGPATNYGTTAYWVAQANNAWVNRTTLQAADYATDLANIWVIRADLSNWNGVDPGAGRGYQDFLVVNTSYIPNREVPEPATWGLLVVGAAIVGLTRKRRSA